MTNETRTPAEIERQIERERAGLTNTLEDLQDKFSIETVARQFTDHLRENGTDISRSVSNAVKDNPMALALTGVGLAWMNFGNRSDDDRARQTASYERDRYARDHMDRPEYYTSSMPVRGKSDPSWMRTEERYGRLTTGVSDDGGGMGEAISDKVDAAKGALQSAKGQASDRLQSAKDKTFDRLQSAKESVAGAADRAKQEATILRARFAEGTEDLSEQARERIIAARQQAVAARDAAHRYTQQGQQRAVDMFEDQPMIGGALALAAGAAIAAALPRSKVEDEYLGTQSDAAMAEAERIFHEEKAKLQQVASVAVDEAKKVAKDVKADMDDKAPDETVATSVAKKVKASGQQVADAAKAEAEKQKLGQG